MAGPKYPGLDTLALHAGAQPDPTTGARATPIYQTASFTFPDSDYAASLFNIERAGHVYSRLSNPTNAVLEERIAALEGGIGAIATASGQAALHLAIVTLMGAGSHIVAASALYGGSHNLLAYTLPRFGIETTFVDTRDPEAFRAAVKDNFAGRFRSRRIGTKPPPAPDTGGRILDTCQTEPGSPGVDLDFVRLFWWA
jgi:O-acetylhomoserine (thiol)-lyase